MTPLAASSSMGFSTFFRKDWGIPVVRFAWKTGLKSGSSLVGQAWIQ
jgi:hypothetical protein